jgi:hypothetical protein
MLECWKFWNFTNEILQMLIFLICFKVKILIIYFESSGMLIISKFENSWKFENFEMSINFEKF